MVKLKRDQRVCPFCAETIKASAIRCRYCHADLTEPTDPVFPPEPEPESESESELGPEPESELDAEPESELDAEPEPEPERESGLSVEGPADSPNETTVTLQAGRPATQKLLTLVLAMLVVVAGAGVGTFWWRAEQENAVVASGGTLVGEEARTEVLVAAADLAKRTLSYGYKSLENDMETARARMTPSFRKEYDATMEQVRANTEKNKIVLEATPVSSAIIEATPDKAKMLVFLNQTTTAGTGKDKNQQLTRSSLVITLTKSSKGDWKISKLAALG